MSAAAIIYLVILGMGLLFSAYKHGKPETGTHNFWVSLVATSLTVGLLLWGGFFSAQ